MGYCKANAQNKMNSFLIDLESLIYFYSAKVVYDDRFVHFTVYIDVGTDREAGLAVEPDIRCEGITLNSKSINRAIETLNEKEDDDE